jgi:hypothetical protein
MKTYISNVGVANYYLFYANKFGEIWIILKEDRNTIKSYQCQEATNIYLESKKNVTIIWHCVCSS